MSASRIRAIERRDLERVWQMVGRLAEFERLTDMVTGSSERLGAALFSEPATLLGLVAEDGGGLVGYALFHPTFSSFRTNPRMWLEDLWIEPEARGSGVGEALVREFARVALARGCHRIDWDVLDWNPARGFYEHLGATPSADGFLKYGMDADRMRALIARG